MITCRCRHRRRRTLILTRCSSVRHFEYFNQNRPPDKPSPAPGPPSRPSPRRATPPPAPPLRSRQRTAPRPRSAPARASRRARAPPPNGAVAQARGAPPRTRVPPHTPPRAAARRRGAAISSPLAEASLTCARRGAGVSVAPPRLTHADTRAHTDALRSVVLGERGACAVRRAGGGCKWRRVRSGALR